MKTNHMNSSCGNSIKTYPKIYRPENTIEIIAINLGTSPPNTSRIEIVDSKIKYPIITQLELGKSAIIKIIK